MLLCSIHTFLWLQLWISVACDYHALLLLNNVVAILLTLSSVLPCVLLVLYASYDHVLAMSSCKNVSSYCWLPFDAM